MIRVFPDSMYVFPDAAEPIAQGDIFRSLPRTEVLLGPTQLPMVFRPTQEGEREVDWLQWADAGDPVIATVAIRPVIGIVINQDCDTSRALHIAMCEIQPFENVAHMPSGTDSKPKSFVEFVTQQARKNQKWYYLPPEARIGFGRMGANFQAVFEVPREMLERHRERLRLGRLNDEVARPHFRERIAEFFRRYPYNEWYPFSSDEVDAYESKQGEVARYSWQRKQI